MPDIEQRPPNKPKFLLIVLLFAAAIIVIVAVGILFIYWGGRHVVPGKHNPHRVSQLVLPQSPAGLTRAS